MVKRQFTAIYKKIGANYLAWIEEVPGVNTQGQTKKEARENLAEALQMVTREDLCLAKIVDDRSKDSLNFIEHYKAWA